MYGKEAGLYLGKEEVSMSKELLDIIEQIEREKGIKKEVLILAAESALLSAVKRVIDVKPNEELEVKLDPETGHIRAFRNHGYPGNHAVIGLYFRF